MTTKSILIIGNALKTLLPGITVFLSIFLVILPYHISNFALLMPLITPITIYFWSIYRPSSLPYFAVFFFGLFKDIIEVNILGLNAIYYLLFQAMAISQRKYIVNKSFIVVWVGFMFCLSMILLLPFVMAKISTYITAYPIYIIYSQWLITACAYVPMHWLLSKLKAI